MKTSATIEIEILKLYFGSNVVYVVGSSDACMCKIINFK